MTNFTTTYETNMQYYLFSEPCDETRYHSDPRDDLASLHYYCNLLFL